ncbi:retrovirus-related pol polyprotein from transposon TNT 1-94 [Tanacetum coccineum]
MALGYQNPFYLKQAQQKQQSLYNGKVLLEKLNPPVVYDSEETLELAQESRLKMKKLNKEIKRANYTNINHLSGVFVSQTAMSREELYFSNTSKMANVSKTISIPNEEFSNDTTPSVARKFLNEVKSTIVTLQRVVKQKMTLDIHNWSSSAHQEIYKIVKDEILPIINQVDARVQNFKIQFLKEAAKFVRDFQSLAKEADESLAKHKALELEIECLLRVVVSQDIMSIVQSNSVVDTSNLQTELERTKEHTLDPLSQKLETENVELEFQVLNYANENAHLKTTYKNRFDSINISKTRVPQKVDETNDLSNPVTSNSVPTSQESKVVKNDKVIAPGMSRINPTKTFREDKFVAINKVSASVRTNPITVSQPHVIARNHVNSDSNGLSFTGVDNIAKTRRPQPRSNTKNDRFLGTVRFGNDHVAAILGFSDLQWGNILITRVYFVEGLGHNLFSVGQFCDSDLKVAFRRNTCFVRNLKEVDLLKGNHTTNLYTINLHEMASASPICLMARATSTKSWLWHQRLSHLNFDTTNDLAKNDLVIDLLKFKYHKEHICPSCEQGKSKRASHPPKQF